MWACCYFFCVTLARFMAVLYGFATRCLFGVVFLHEAKQGRWLCAVSTHKSLPHRKNRAPFHHKRAKSLRPSQSHISFPRHGYCDVFFFFCRKIFLKFLVLRNLTCAQEPRWVRVAWWTRTFYIRSSNWIIPNTAHVQSIDCLRVGRSMFCNAILISQIPWVYG